MKTVHQSSQPLPPDQMTLINVFRDMMSEMVSDVVRAVVQEELAKQLQIIENIIEDRLKEQEAMFDKKINALRMEMNVRYNSLQESINKLATVMSQVVQDIDANLRVILNQHDQRLIRIERIVIPL